MQKEFDDTRAAGTEMALHLDDRAIAAAPEMLLARVGLKPFDDEQLGVHADDQNFFVVRAVEDADPSARGKNLVGAPQEVVTELLLAWLLERMHLASLWIEAGQDVADDAVLAGCIHSLQDDQQGVAVC